MELKQLQSFAAVVEQGSFTKAAEVLHITQPAISTHIRALEEELHTLLLARTTKSLQVTPRGRELYECAVNMLRLRDDLLRRWSGETKQIIKLGASTIPAAYLLPALLTEYGKSHPAVYFSIHQSDSRGVVGALLDGRFDVGLVGVPCADEALSCIPFYQDRMVLITPVNDYFLGLKDQGEFPMEALCQEAVILREDGSGKKNAARFLEDMGIREADLRVTARVNDQEAVKNLVAGGVGVSFLSECAARDYAREKRLLLFELPEQAGRRSLYLVFHKQYTLRPHIQRFTEYVLRFFASGKANTIHT